jgi:ABC-2 type transport system ATP-binding protein
MQPALEIVDLAKNYGQTAALRGVSFQVCRGEIFGLLGPNGAGKTTLLSILSGLQNASSGKVRIEGQDALPMKLNLRQSIGLVPQELAVYNELTARENLLFFGAIYGVAEPDLSCRVDQVLNAVGLAERAHKRVDTFSGGMKRRLNLGAALVHRPGLLLLDEPTTGVDPQSRNHIFQEIREVNRQGATVVYTSHYMEEVQALCPRVGIVDHGTLIACDRVDRLLQQVHGFIRFQVKGATNELRHRLSGLGKNVPDSADDQSFELQCTDVKATLLRVVATLNELNVELLALETREPNLEHLFLHLTGRALRD